MRIIGVGFPRLQQSLLAIGLAVAAILLIRFAWDFSSEMPVWLVMPFWLLVATVLSVGALNIFGQPGKSRRVVSGWESLLLVSTIPAGFIASSLDCTGLSARGCSPFCTFIKAGWIFLIALACAAYFMAVRKRESLATGNSEAAKSYDTAAILLLLLTVMIFVPLAPHCLCYNAGNGWWIETLGASPTCYSWGFAASLIAIGSLNARARTRVSLLVCLAIIGGALGFFLTHHYFHFPW